MLVLDRIALLLAIIGAVNWGLVGVFQFDLVAFICGGQGAVISRVTGGYCRTMVRIAAFPRARRGARGRRKLTLI